MKLNGGFHPKPAWPRRLPGWDHYRRQARIFDAWLLTMFQGANDGKVSVERAKLAGMTDFIVVHENHSFITKSEQVQFQTIEFLNNEAFLHDNSSITEEIDSP